MDEHKGQPALGASMQRFLEQFRAVDDTIVVVLKGHLLIEEALDGIISKFVFHVEPLADARLSFWQKLHVARAMSLRESENGMWEIAKALNALRNELAHQLDSPGRVRKMEALLAAYRRETEGSADMQKALNLPEPEAVRTVIAFFLGFLASFQAEVDRFRNITRALDVAMNSPPGK